VLSQRWPRDARYISGSNESMPRYGHSKLSKMAACRQVGFDVTGNSAIRSADLENPRTKHEVYRIIRCGDMAIRVSWGIWNPMWWEVVGGQRWHHSKERWWFPIGSRLWPLRTKAARRRIEKQRLLVQFIRETLESRGLTRPWASVNSGFWVQRL